MAKKPTIQDNWDVAVNKARDAIQELIEIQSDCQEKYEEMTEEQQDSEKGTRLQEVCNLNLDEANDIIDEATGLKVL